MTATGYFSAHAIVGRNYCSITLSVTNGYIYLGLKVTYNWYLTGITILLLFLSLADTFIWDLGQAQVLILKSTFADPSFRNGLQNLYPES